MNTGLSAYLAGGFGASFIHGQGVMADSLALVSTSRDSQNRVNFSWDVGLGILYSFNKSWFGTLGVNYIDLGKVNFGRFYPAPPISSGITISARDTHASQVNMSLGYRF